MSVYTLHNRASGLPNKIKVLSESSAHPLVRIGSQFEELLKVTEVKGQEFDHNPPFYMSRKTLSENYLTELQDTVMWEVKSSPELGNSPDSLLFAEILQSEHDKSKLLLTIDFIPCEQYELVRTFIKELRKEGEEL